MDILPAAPPAVPLIAGVAFGGAAGGTAQFAAMLGELLAPHGVNETAGVSQSPPGASGVRAGQAISDPVVTALKTAVQTQPSDNAPHADMDQAIAPSEFDKAAIAVELNVASPAKPQPLAEVSPSVGMTPALKPPMQPRASRLRPEESEPEDVTLAEYNCPTLPEVAWQTPAAALPSPATMPAGPPQKEAAQATDLPSRSPSDSLREDSAVVSVNERPQAPTNARTVIGTRAGAHSPIEDASQDDPSSAPAVESVEQSGSQLSHSPNPVRDHRPLGRLEELIRPVAVQVCRQIQASIPLAHFEKPTATQMVIRLNPPELGAVRIQVERPKEGGAAVTLTVERPETLILLLRDREGLSQALDRAGVPSDRRVVTYQAASPVNPIDTPRNDSDPGQTPDRLTGQGGGFGSSHGQGDQRGWAGGEHPCFDQPGAAPPPEARFLTLTDRIDITA